MKRFFLDNVGWKLLSVLLAFLLWIAVAREPELATSVAAPILFRNMPSDLDMASGVPDRIQLELRGPGRRLTPASLAQTVVVLNLADVQPGERTFNIRDGNVRGLPIGVMFYRAVPSQVSIRFERLTIKAVPIMPSYGKGRPGITVTNFRFDPPTVTLRGPQDRVEGIDHVTTDPIDLNTSPGAFTTRVHVRVPDPQVGIVSPTTGVIVHLMLHETSNKETNQ